MRKGDNPASNQQLLDDPALHRLIIPLYIPQEEGYFEQAFPIFELSLRSALKTSSSNLTVSVVSNGSCEAVHQKLHQLQEQGLIDASTRVSVPKLLVQKFAISHTRIPGDHCVRTIADQCLHFGCRPRRTG